jgi:hypothetical protein
MSNKYYAFQELFRKEVKYVGTVLSHDAGGFSTIQTPDGAKNKVRGQTVAIGLNAYVTDGVMISSAPTLPLYTIDL